MAFEEIKAGLEKYTVEIDEEKRNAARNLSVKYIVKEHNTIINDGNNFYVYAHYPTTVPDVMIMPFVSKVNAELFCEALNAENEHREVDLVKHGYWEYDGDCFICTSCGKAIGFLSSKCVTDFCPFCGAKMNGETNG